MDSKIILFLGASLTLGLAPFVPEPHILGKLRWILGGGVGMGTMDYFDLIMHGTPWILLLYHVGLTLGQKFKTNKNDK